MSPASFRGSLLPGTRFIEMALHGTRPSGSGFSYLTFHLNLYSVWSYFTHSFPLHPSVLLYEGTSFHLPVLLRGTFG